MDGFFLREFLRDPGIASIKATSPFMVRRILDRMDLAGRRLVVEYYEGFSFGKFIRRFPHHQGDVTDLLIGDLFKDELDEVFRSVDTMYAENGAGVSAAEE